MSQIKIFINSYMNFNSHICLFNFSFNLHKPDIFSLHYAYFCVLYFSEFDNLLAPNAMFIPNFLTLTLL